MPILSTELTRRGFEEVSPYEFYREIFGDGNLDEEGAQTKGKYCGIAVEVTKQTKLDADGNKVPVIKRHNIYDDFNAVDELIWTDNFCVTSPISYAGKSRSADNAADMYALCIELDNLITKKNGEQTGLDRLINQWGPGPHWIPQPTFVVASGSGLHLYYVFDEPFHLYPNTVEELTRMKRELTTKIWNRHTTRSHTKELVQQESIFQGFRMVGTVTKYGDRATAHRTGPAVTMDYLNEFVEPENRVTFAYKSKLPLRVAKVKYPEWYERRITNKNAKGVIPFSSAVYHWFKERITKEAVVGRRYNCMEALASFARKCSYYDAKKNPEPVTFDELKKDCLELMEVFEARTDDPKNHFTKQDVNAALRAWHKQGYIHYSRESIEFKTGISMPSQKRNGRKQKDHLTYMQKMKELKLSLGECTPGGRPAGESKERDIVLAWRRENPTGKKAACARETGVHRNTVARWWDEPLQPEKKVPARATTFEELDAMMEAYEAEEITDTDSYLDALIAEAMATPAEPKSDKPKRQRVRDEDLPF